MPSGVSYRALVNANGMKEAGFARGTLPYWWIPAPRFHGDKLRGNDVCEDLGTCPRPDAVPFNTTRYERPKTSYSNKNEARSSHGRASVSVSVRFVYKVWAIGRRIISLVSTSFGCSMA